MICIAKVHNTTKWYAKRIAAAAVAAAGQTHACKEKVKDPSNKHIDDMKMESLAKPPPVFVDLVLLFAIDCPFGVFYELCTSINTMKTKQQKNQ